MNKVIIKDYKSYLSAEDRQSLQKRFEANFELVVKTLGLKDDYPAITYYLYPTEVVKIQETGEDGYAETDRAKHAIYLVYNKDIQPIGPHELVHILTNKLNTPNFVFNEGLAEYFEDGWKADIDGVDTKQKHDEWVRRFIKEGNYVSIDTLFYDSKFWEADESALFSYPESGSFIRFLVSKYGLEQIMAVFMKLKRRPRELSFNHDVFKNTLGLSVAEAEKEWLSDIERHQ